MGRLGLLMLRSRMLSRVWGQVCPAASSVDVVHSFGSVRVGECPAEAGEFAGHGDRDNRAPLSTLGVESLPDVM